MNLRAQLIFGDRRATLGFDEQLLTKVRKALPQLPQSRFVERKLLLARLKGLIFTIEQLVSLSG